MERANHDPDPVPPGLDSVASYFRLMGWAFDPIDKSTLFVPRSVSSGSLQCFAHVYDRALLFESLYPFSVPPSKLMLVAEFVTRANWHTPFGTLQLDFDDGEVMVKTALVISTASLSLPLVEAVVHPNLAAADRWFRGLAAVCFADVSPRIAVEQCVRTVSVHDMMAQVNESLWSDTASD